MSEKCKCCSLPTMEGALCKNILGWHHLVLCVPVILLAFIAHISGSSNYKVQTQYVSQFCAAPLWPISVMLEMAALSIIYLTSSSVWHMTNDTRINKPHKIASFRRCSLTLKTVSLKGRMGHSHFAQPESNGWVDGWMDTWTDTDGKPKVIRERGTSEWRAVLSGIDGRRAE